MSEAAEGRAMQAAGLEALGKVQETLKALVSKVGGARKRLRKRKSRKHRKSKKGGKRKKSRRRRKSRKHKKKSKRRRRK